MPETSLPTPHTPPRRTRVPLVIAGALTALLATALLLGGGAALWAQGKKDDDGYLSTHTHRFTTTRAALATDNLDVELDGVKWLVDSGDFGKVRMNVASTSGKPVFAGIARTRDVSAFLRGVSHTRVHDIDTDPFQAHYRASAGRRSQAPRPGGRSIWAASTQGSGTRTLTWKVKAGDWSVVVMNADGSPGVSADVNAGAKLPFLTAVAWSSIGGGVLFLGLSSVLIAFGMRRRPASPAPTAAEPVPSAA